MPHQEEAAQNRDALQSLYKQISEALIAAACTVPPLSDFDLNLTLEHTGS